MIVYCHGLESGPWGSKSCALRDAGLPVISPDFRKMDIRERTGGLSIILQSFDEPVIIVGSSFGGPTALRAASLVPNSVSKIVLCAPALTTDLWATEKPSPVPCEVLHGENDSIIPISWSERFCALNGYALHKVGDDHRLATEHSIKKLIGLVS